MMSLKVTVCLSASMSIYLRLSKYVYPSLSHHFVHPSVLPLIGVEWTEIEAAVDKRPNPTVADDHTVLLAVDTNRHLKN